MIGIFVIMAVFVVAGITLTIAGLWKIFEKAGQAGWKSLIPFYNAVVLLKIVGKPAWWMIPMCFTFTIGAALTMAEPYGSYSTLSFLLNITGYVFSIWACNMLSKSFGKNEGFTVGIVLLYFIFLPILGFGDAQYLGPYGDKAAFDAYNQNNRFDFEDNKFSS